MNALLELLDAITSVMLGVEEGGRARQDRESVRHRSVHPSPGGSRGFERRADDSLCLGEAVLVYAVEPLITPEGQGLADVAVHQFEANGASVERVKEPHPGVLSVAGSLEDGWLEARILASRGWVFLISAPSEWDARGLAGSLDVQIAELEGDSRG